MNAPTVLDRKRFIGGSDAAAILGVSPWATRLDLFLIKTGQRAEVVDPARAKLFRRGKRLEPVVVDMLIDEYDVVVTTRSYPDKPNRYADPTVPYLAAEIDFEWKVTPKIAAEFDLPEALIGTIQNGEVKTVHPFASAKFGDEADEIPVEYAAQAMHGLMVTGRAVCMFAVMVGADNLSLYWIHRDDETIAGMRAQEIAFWNDNVLANVPPEPVNLPDIFELFKRELASRVEASPEIADDVAALAALRSTERTAKEGQEELKFRIGKFILGEAGIMREIERDGSEGHVRPTEETKPGVHELRLQGLPILQIVMQNQRRIDTDALREKHPDVAAECVHVVQSLKFQSPKKGKRK